MGGELNEQHLEQDAASNLLKSADQRLNISKKKKKILKKKKKKSVAIKTA